MSSGLTLAQRRNSRISVSSSIVRAKRRIVASPASTSSATQAPQRSGSKRSRRQLSRSSRCAICERPRRAPEGRAPCGPTSAHRQVEVAVGERADEAMGFGASSEEGSHAARREAQARAPPVGGAQARCFDVRMVIARDRSRPGATRPRRGSRVASRDSAASVTRTAASSNDSRDRDPRGRGSRQDRDARVRRDRDRTERFQVVDHADLLEHRGRSALIDSQPRIATAGTIGFLKKTPAARKTAP